jgi:hypothetical protein
MHVVGSNGAAWSLPVVLSPDSPAVQSNPSLASLPIRGPTALTNWCNSVIGWSVRGHQAPSIGPVVAVRSRSISRIGADASRPMLVSGDVFTSFCTF